MAPSPRRKSNRAASCGGVRKNSLAARAYEKQLECRCTCLLVSQAAHILRDALRCVRPGVARDVIARQRGDGAAQSSTRAARLRIANHGALLQRKQHAADAVHDAVVRLLRALVTE
jgi:hypothetical protein